MSAPYEGDSGTLAVPGVKGTNNIGGDGVFGFANQNGRGVVGVSELRTGVEGNSTSGVGVWGASQIAEGVHGASHGRMAGVAGYNDGTGPGLWGESQANEGVRGVSHGAMAGATGTNDHDGPGLWGESQGNDGVHGVSHSQTHSGVFGADDHGGFAGFFQGNVVVTGNISVSGTDLLGAVKKNDDQILALEGQITQLAQGLAALRSAMAG